ncbi:MAG: NBR1-Ig-like domain-containing protein, partial [Anaerolineae bacterium]|nr:NBR1-Ig-like domain-containing protein [Anaerolineae bacterium]
MKPERIHGAVWLIMLFTLALVACNFPVLFGDATPETTMTIMAPGLTIVFPTATAPVIVSPSPAVTPTSAIVEDEGDCILRAAFVEDVTVPDDSVFASNTDFVKTWRIRNSGTCTWSAGTTLEFLSGDAVGVGDAVTIPVTAPGEEIDVSVDFKTPADPGNYRSNWQMVKSGGTTRFGGVFYVKFIVQAPDSSQPPDESGTPPRQFIGKTAVDCQKVTLSWEDGTGERAYTINAAGLEVPLDADITTYVWQNPPTGTSVITLTASNDDNTVLAELHTRVNVNCDADRPNLVITEMRFEPVEPVAYLPLTLTLKIENDGAVDSGAIVVRWYKITTLPEPSCDWIHNDGLDAGETISLTCDVDPYSSVNDFVIRAKVDATQAVVESDEVDNTVDETVTVIAPAVVYDFVVQAPSAAWTSGDPGQILTWPGQDTDSQGFVRWKTGELENGTFATDNCLQTHPKWVENGWVQGAYTTHAADAYQVRYGDF